MASSVGYILALPPAIATIHDVILRAGILNAQLARHTGRPLVQP